MKTTIILIFLALIVGFGLGYGGKSDNVIVQTDTITVEKHHYDTVRIKNIEYKEVKVPKYVTIVDSLIVHRIDTHYVFSDYFTKRHVDTTFTKKDVYTANIKATIHMNKLNNLTFSNKIYQKEKIITKTVYQPERWHFAFEVMPTSLGNCWFGGAAQTKQNFEFGYMYDVMNNGHALKLGYVW